MGLYKFNGVDDWLRSRRTAVHENRMKVFMGPFGDVGLTRCRDAGLEVVYLTWAMFARAGLALDYVDLPRVRRVVSHTN